MMRETTATQPNPWVQIAIDATSIDRAQELTALAVEAGAAWIEVGTPLITFEGVRAIDAVVAVAQGHPIVVDYKSVDGVAKYFAEASRRGAELATVLGAAPDASIRAAVAARDEGGCQVLVDLYGLQDKVLRARQVAELGADFVMLHVGFDETREDPGRDPLEHLDEVVAAIDLPVGVATFTVQQAVEAVGRGASWVVQGEPLLSSPDAGQLLAEFVNRVSSAA